VLTSIAKIIAKLHPNAGLFQYAKAVRKRYMGAESTFRGLIQTFWARQQCNRCSSWQECVLCDECEDDS
jgi:hypothetical protein